MTTAGPLLFADGLTWSRPDGTPVLAGAALRVDAGEVVALRGPSGSGKTVLGTTLLRLRDVARPGRVVWDDTDVTDASPRALRPLRARFQGLLQHTGALLPSWTTVGEALRETIRTVGGDDARAAELTDRLGLDDLLDRHPASLSGGEQRRASLARVLLARPAFAFIDEPDAGLDPLSCDEVLTLIREAASTDGVGVLLVTHRDDLAERFADRTLTPTDGVLRW